MNPTAQNSADMHVLIVDDHPSLVWGLQKVMESAGPGIVLAGSANCRRLAIEALHKTRVDIVLLDVELGPDCGIDMIPEIRAAHARVLILSGTTDTEIRRRAIVAGASGFVPKSAPVETILAALRHVHSGNFWLQSEDMESILGVAARQPRAGSPGRSGPERDELTPAERKVVAAVVTRRSSPNKVIADALHISTHTLRNHLASVYSKLDLHSRLDLVFYAREKRLDQSVD
jgi:DNA-binding NarL/FixJ family response regulator